MVEKKNCQQLHNYVGKHRLGELTYEDKDKLINPGNRHVWTSIVQLKGTTYGEGQGRTIPEARDKAAGIALSALQAKFGS